MIVYTSTVRYNGPDRLDITVKTGNRAFAPTWELVLGFKKGALSWEDYSWAYRVLMLKSYRDNRAEWDALLQRDQVTLVCYCKDEAFCHRWLLANYLAKMGADFRGER